MRLWKNVLWAVALAGLAVGSGGAGCIITVEPDDNDNENNNANDNNNPPPAASTIIVRIINATDVPLDPEVYISADELGPNELFVRELKFTRLGVGNTGILDQASADSFEVECEQLRVVGTAGGRFGENLRDPDGVGRRLILTRQLNVFCGDVVTFTYERSDNEEGFTTTFDVEEAD